MLSPYASDKAATHFPPATSFRQGEFREELSCRFAFVGDHTPAREAFIGALTHQPGLKIFGGGPWPFHQNLGRLTAADLPALYASAEYTLVDGDNPGRVLDIWAAGGLPLLERDHSAYGVPALSQALLTRNMNRIGHSLNVGHLR